MSLYERLGATAERLLAKYPTGTLEKITVTTTPAANEWEAPAETVEYGPFDGLIMGVDNRLIDGDRVLIGDRLLYVAGDVDIKSGDMIRVDGVGAQVLAHEEYPAAGTRALKSFIVRG